MKARVNWGSGQQHVINEFDMSGGGERKFLDDTDLSLAFAEKMDDKKLFLFVDVEDKPVEMFCNSAVIETTELEPTEIRDALRCILHTIFFHTTLSLVRPKDVDCDFLEITYVQCGLLEFEKEVDEKIDQFTAWVEKHPNRRSQV
ncbi:unnamed protein product [Miscanthus lutarioriparius]|uniref:Autophagy-related protein 101 n=1 Tax=Miscanthus lutarioriparius TaxID=422564 RepID=A0A811RJT8_9POAL|nr:unnamed protein product [Miscanthus lutarioriparius]